MIRFLRLVGMELRNIWLLTLILCAGFSAALLAAPDLLIWCVISFIFPFMGIIIKVIQCVKDYRKGNMLLLYSVPVNRYILLGARITAGALAAWFCYGCQMAVMLLGGQFHGINSVWKNEVWRDLYRSYLVQYAVDRTGMFSPELSIVLRMLLVLTLFTLLVELFFVAREVCAFAYGMIVFLYFAFRCCFLKLPKGATLYLFLVTRLPAICDIIFYILCFLVCFWWLRQFRQGMEVGRETYISTTGHEAA